MGACVARMNGLDTVPQEHRRLSSVPMDHEYLAKKRVSSRRYYYAHLEENRKRAREKMRRLYAMTPEQRQAARIAKRDARLRKDTEILKFIDAHRSIIYGTLLGDSTIGVQEYGPVGRMVCLHAEDQKDYLFHKHSVFAPVATSAPRSRQSSNPNGQLEWRFTTKTSNEWYRLWQIFHQGSKKKTVTADILDALDDQGLAFWIMDDGCYSYMRSKSRPDYMQYRFHLCTEAFSQAENELIRSWFLERYGVHFAVERQKRRLKSGVIATYHRLRLGMIEYERQIVPRIQPFVIPSMVRKITRVPPLQVSTQ